MGPAGMKQTPATKLTEVELHFYGVGSISEWRRTCAKLGILENSRGSGPFAESFVLVEGAADQWQAVFGQVHSVGAKREEEGFGVHWHLDWVQNASTPPKGIVANSKKLGGYPGFFSRLLEKWPKTSPRECSGDVVYWFDAPESIVKRLPWPERVSLEPRRFTPTSVTWKIEPPFGVVSEVRVSPDSNRPALVASGPWRGTISESILTDLGERASGDIQDLIAACSQ
jgi:hypothetical protein